VWKTVEKCGKPNVLREKEDKKEKIIREMEFFS